MHVDAIHTATQWAVALPTMYTLMSLNEYATHRYFQHLEFNRPESLPYIKKAVALITRDETPPTLKGDGHVEHHAETYDNMALKSDERWLRTPASNLLDDDDFRGTAFHWHATGIMTVQMLPSVLPTFALMGWSLPATLAWLLPCMLLHAAVWNAIHPPMHGLPPVPIHKGVPSALLADALCDTAYYRFIYENHMGHHVLGGQCNYNVCCPGADHLLGTYVRTEQWSSKMRPLPVGAVTRGAPVGPKGVPEPPMWADVQAAKQQRRGSAESTPAAIVGGGAVIADAYSS